LPSSGCKLLMVLGNVKLGINEWPIAGYASSGGESYLKEYHERAGDTQERACPSWPNAVFVEKTSSFPFPLFWRIFALPAQFTFGPFGPMAVTPDPTILFQDRPPTFPDIPFFVGCYALLSLLPPRRGTPILLKWTRRSGFLIVAASRPFVAWARGGKRG